MKLLSALMALVLFAAVPAPAAQAAISGTSPGTQIYYMGSVQETTGRAGGRHICGSVVVEALWVLTAKQCVQGKDPGSLTIRVGSRYHASEGELLPVAQIIPHSTSDVALIKLSRPNSVIPVGRLTGWSSWYVESKVLGWGQTCPTAGCGGLNPQLQQVAARTEQASACHGQQGRFCTTYANGGGPCFGDEGGPLVSKDGLTLLGLVPGRVPGADDCAEDRQPLVDLTVLHVWIEQHIA